MTLLKVLWCSIQWVVLFTFSYFHALIVWYWFKKWSILSALSSVAPFFLSKLIMQVPHWSIPVVFVRPDGIIAQGTVFLSNYVMVPKKDGLLFLVADLAFSFTTELMHWINFSQSLTHNKAFFYCYFLSSAEYKHTCVWLFCFEE